MTNYTTFQGLINDTVGGSMSAALFPFLVTENATTTPTSWTVACTPGDYDMVGNIPAGTKFTVNTSGINEDNPGKSTMVFKLTATIDGVAKHKFTRKNLSHLPNVYSLLPLLAEFAGAPWQASSTAAATSTASRERMRSLDKVTSDHMTRIVGIMKNAFGSTVVVHRVSEYKHSDQEKGRDTRAKAYVGVRNGVDAVVTLNPNHPLAITDAASCILDVQFNCTGLNLKEFSKALQVLTVSEPKKNWGPWGPTPLINPLGV